MLFLISSLTLEGRSFKLRWEGEDDFKRLTANYSGVFLMRHWALLICHWFEPLKVVNACLFWKLKDVFVLKISAYQCVLPRWVTRTIKSPDSLDFKEVTNATLLVQGYMSFLSFHFTVKPRNQIGGGKHRIFASFEIKFSFRSGYILRYNRFYFRLEFKVSFIIGDGILKAQKVVSYILRLRSVNPFS